MSTFRGRSKSGRSTQRPALAAIQHSQTTNTEVVALPGPSRCAVRAAAKAEQDAGAGEEHAAADQALDAVLLPDGIELIFDQDIGGVLCQLRHGMLQRAELIIVLWGRLRKGAA